MPIPLNLYKQWLESCVYGDIGIVVWVSCNFFYSVTKFTFLSYGLQHGRRLVRCRHSLYIHVFSLYSWRKTWEIRWLYQIDSWV